MTPHELITLSAKQIFPPETAEQLLRQLLAHSNLSRAEAVSVLRWAQSVRVDNAMLDGILAGHVAVQLGRDGSPRFTLTPDGNAIAAAIAATSTPTGSQVESFDVDTKILDPEE